MKGKELIDYINEINAISSHFKGVYSINTMPKSLLKRHFFFANIDLNHGSGSHWICVLRNDDNELELFDSLGNTNTKLEWFLKYCFIKPKHTLIYNETPVQSPFSASCGKYVLYFIIKRLFNLDISFHQLLNKIFETNLDENEIIVANFLRSLKDGF